jgi:hypothetical protein
MNHHLIYNKTINIFSAQSLCLHANIMILNWNYLNFSLDKYSNAEYSFPPGRWFGKCTGKLKTFAGNIQFIYKGKIKKTAQVSASSDVFS